MNKLLLLLFVCVSMVGCGTKGPLYIPEQTYPQPIQPEQALPAQ